MARNPIITYKASLFRNALRLLYQENDASQSIRVCTTLLLSSTADMTHISIKTAPACLTTSKVASTLLLEF